MTGVATARYPIVTVTNRAEPVGPSSAPPVAAAPAERPVPMTSLLPERSSKQVSTLMAAQVRSGRSHTVEDSNRTRGFHR